MTDLPSHTRGDIWMLAITCTVAEHDWTGVVVRCQLRRTDGSLIYDIGQASGITTSFAGDTLTIGLTVPGSVTRNWSGTLEGDVELSRGSPAWGPYTPLSFRFTVNQDRTR